MISIAIVGGGFAGLALAWHLSQHKNCKVTIFDPKGIGGGASGMACGLLHPYVGQQARRSWKADEGIKATLRLLDVAESVLKQPVANRAGILRLGLNADQIENLTRHIKEHGDVEKKGDNQFLISSGITVNSSLYLKGLWKACKELGVVHYPVRVENLAQLKDYDRIFIAAGHETHHFEECRKYPIKLIKGQTLTCKKTLDRSVIGKGYVALDGTEETMHLGATYERTFTSEEPCLPSALKALKGKFKGIVPDEKFEVMSVHAGIRATNKEHYLPIAGKVDDKTWILSALGSRGLLYHAYFAEKISAEMLQELKK